MQTLHKQHTQFHAFSQACLTGPEKEVGQGPVPGLETDGGERGWRAFQSLDGRLASLVGADGSQTQQAGHPAGVPRPWDVGAVRRARGRLGPRAGSTHRACTTQNPR